MLNSTGSGIFRRGRAVVLLASATLLLPALPAAAQQGSERAMLEEIVVTASRREQAIQDVAVAVTAISGDVLDRSFAQDARDLNGLAPNVQLMPVGAFQNASAFFIRGVGSTDIESSADPGIASFVNDVYQGRTSTALVDFLDIESVEILRGPQGTLFGRNSIGGVVHVKQAEPQFDAATADVSLLLGSRDRRDMTLVFNVPASEELAFRLAAKTARFDGFYKNRGPGGDVNGQDRFTILPSMKWEPTENLDILVRGEYNRTRDDSWGNIPYSACREDPATAVPFSGANDVIIDFVSGIFGQPEQARRYCAGRISHRSFNVEHDQATGNYSDFDIWGITSRVNYRVPNLGTFTYVGNYREVDEDVINDFDTTPFALFETRRQQDHYQTSHELRFASELSERFDLVAGLFLFEQDYELNQDTFGALVGGQIYGRSKQRHNNWGIFSQIDYHLTDQITLIAGLRYDEEKKKFRHCGVGAGDPGLRICQLDIGGVLTDTTVTDSQTWDNVSPKLGAQYFFTPDFMAYATWARGFRSGGYNGRATSPTTIGPYDEEQADSYEIGIKATLLDGRMRVSLAAFELDYDKLQRPVIRPSPSGGGGQETVTENVGSARNRGAELEINALLLPGLSMDLTVGYLDAENREWCAPVQGIQATDTPPAGFSQCAPSSEVLDATSAVVGFLVPIDASGLEPPQAPEWSARLGLAYEHFLGDLGSVVLAGSWRYQSKANIVGAGLPPGSTDGILNYDGTRADPIRKSNDVVDLNLTWRSLDQRYRVAAFVKNVTDEQYLSTGTFVGGLFNFVQLNEPRHWGLELSASLGN